MEAMESMVEGCVETEDTGFCHDILAEEVNELMDIDKLCQMIGTSAEDDDDGNGEEGGKADDIPQVSVNAYSARVGNPAQGTISAFGTHG